MGQILAVAEYRVAEEQISGGYRCLCRLWCRHYDGSWYAE